MTFRDLGLIAPILSALEDQGYTRPSPIQEKAIPPALEGRDVLGCAQTGTGKTCAFAAPILQRLSAAPAAGRPVRALVLTPTRELAIQIGESFAAYGKGLKLRHTVIFGGVGQNPQVEALKKGADILVATPGRLMDLHGQGFVSLDRLEIFVLDEADRMLDMGFIHDVRKILKWLPEKKQTLFFSATMPPEITELVNSLLRSPVRVAVNPVSSPVEAIEQSVYLVDKANKTRLLAHLVRERKVKNALVFTRTKHGANKVARDLGKEGISAAAIHGNKSQTARQQALADFKSGRLRCLVATDIAARGLDIEELSHVFNYNLPEVPETYVHRIGRTGRAGRGGQAVAFCDFGEKPLLKDIEKLIGRPVSVVEDHPYPMQVFEAPKRDKHGRIINEEDAEARAAARKLGQERRAAKAQAVPLAAPSSPEPEEGRRSRRRKKEAAQAAPPPAAPAVPAPQPAPRAARPKLVRPGERMDTGDTMPETEFSRPDPLAGERIMDATARLLAPRRLTLSPAGRPAPQRTEEAPAQKSGRKRRRKKSASGGQTVQSPPPLTPPAMPKAARQKARPGEGARPVPENKKRRARQDRQSGRRGAPMEPQKSGQTKDSTQQESLMKPFYLDF